MSDILQPDWPLAYGGTVCSAQLRTVSSDFYVEEILGFEPEGEGEHLFLWVEKQDANTEWVARQLAQYADISPKQVAYAGLKDRYAVTRQWFSLHLPGKALSLQSLEIEGVKVLRAERHPRKLRKGVLKGNHFKLVLRHVQGEQAAIEARLHLIAQQGVPNYFTEQRFGHGFANVQQGLAVLLRGKRERSVHKRSLYLSAVQSYLFNQLLALRIQQQTWDQLQLHDIAQFQTSNSMFQITELDTVLQQRCEQGELHPTGPIWGQSKEPEAILYQQELQSLATYADWTQALTKAASMQRRALRLRPQDFSWEFQQDQLHLQFSLNSGQYATALLRELVDYTQNTWNGGKETNE